MGSPTPLRKGRFVMPSRRRRLALALALLLTLLPWTAAAAVEADAPTPSSFLTSILDWLADHFPSISIVAPSTAAPHLDSDVSTDSDGFGLHLDPGGTQSATSQPPDDGERGPHLDPDG